ncbi:DUF2194 domain-containing protein [Nitratireductor pacificus]|uniref:Uncharacterized protein n=1 Tax=Nitratireductor pacificus pht-3B TaxID=391937 RepID=K2M970_9HYPH|nr:DUF2194 domain-containing protein [Nitratireductor pacificus]EKF18631.1 hypothetical protein NA2_12064 [Nitratireductor pacificus pht-3B]
MLTTARNGISGWLSGWRTGARREREQRILLLTNSADAYASGLRDNALKALDYARLRADCWDMAGAEMMPRLDRYSCLLLCSEFLNRLDRHAVGRIRAYVAAGGGIAVIYRGWHRELADLFGIDDDRQWPGFRLAGDAGLSFVSDLMPGFAGLSLSGEDMAGHAPYDFLPQSAATIVATDGEGRALAWLKRAGEGRVLYWNTAVLAVPAARGLIVQSVACVQQRTVLPIANVGLVHVDDFPPADMDTLPEPAASEFPGMKPAAFYYDVWHADMTALARRFGITYTYFAILDYAGANPGDGGSPARAMPPQFERTAVREAARDGELGLHGYNHNSLTVEHWDSPEAMRTSLETVRGAWQDWPGQRLPFSYAPPNNEYDETGARALAAAFPEIGAICSTYGHGDYEHGGSREFGPEPWAETLFAVPRATSGMEMHPQSRFEMASQIETFGVWTHFIHPDDVFDTPEREPGAGQWRNPEALPWRGAHGLLGRFASWLASVGQAYPWLRYMDTRSAVPMLEAHLRRDYAVGFGENHVRVEAGEGAYFRFRSNDLTRINPAGVANAELIDVDEHDGFAVYTLRATAPEAVIELI